MASEEYAASELATVLLFVSSLEGDGRLLDAPRIPTGAEEAAAVLKEVPVVAS